MFEHLFSVFEILSPFLNSVERLFALQSLEHKLVLNSDSHQLFLSKRSIQRLRLLRRNEVRVVVLFILHNVGHLLQQNPVRALNFSEPSLN